MIRTTHPANADIGVTVTEHLFPSIGKTVEISASTSLATALGHTIPTTAGAVDIWCTTNTLLYLRFDGSAATNSDYHIVPNSVYRIYGYKFLLDKIRLYVDGGLEESSSSSSSVAEAGITPNCSILIYTTDETQEEWMSSSTSSDDYSESTSTQTVSNSSKSTASTSSISSVSTSSTSLTSESSISSDDDWQANNG